MLFDQFKGTNMNFRKTLLALSVLGAAGLSGCGGSSHDHPVLTSASGTAVDGYLQNATACFDTTGDKSCADEASSVTTDINGDYSLSSTGAGDAIILVESVAGVTTESDEKGVAGALAGAFTLTGIQGSTIISPFSTMIQIGVEHGVYASASAAEAAIATSLGLTGVDLATYDFIAEGNVTVTAIAEAITDIIENNITEVAAISTAAGATYGSETLLETAILELIDTDVGDTVSDFDAVTTVVIAAVVANPAADVATITADATVTAAVTTTSVDSTDAADATDVGTSLDTVNDTNATETGGTTGTGGTGGTGAI